jgi:hypothetical protein
MGGLVIKAWMMKGNSGVVTYGSDFLTGGTASASTEYNATYAASKACDNNTGTWWNNNNALPSWWRYDLGAGVTKIARRTKLSKIMYGNTIHEFTIQGSNDIVTPVWDTLATGHMENSTYTVTVDFANSTAYRYYQIVFSNSYNQGWMTMDEVEFMEVI